MLLLKEIKESLLQLAFPHVCAGCGRDSLKNNDTLCLHCLSSLPETNFFPNENNAVEKIFWGRMPVVHAAAQYYFTKESMMQHLMHQFKYRANKQAGFFLGKLMGEALASSNRFSDIDALIPLPLHPSRERKRGYNQAAVLCDGISTVINKPVLKNSILRTENTESQTKKGRVARWENMNGRFELVNPLKLAGKHVLLVDDIVTTGATLEACGRELLKAKDLQLSIATLCFSSEN